jgi:hypothetical protein
MPRTCSQAGTCLHRHGCDSSCDVFYTHVPVRGPSLAAQHPFAPGELDGPHYKQRNRKHLARWMVRAIVLVGVISFVSGFVRGLMQ